MSHIKFTNVAGPFHAQNVIVGTNVVGIIRKRGQFYVLTAKDGSTFETEVMRYSYAKMFKFRSDAQKFAKEHWNPLKNQ